MQTKFGLSGLRDVGTVDSVRTSTLAHGLTRTLVHHLGMGKWRQFESEQTVDLGVRLRHATLEHPDQEEARI